MRIQPLPFQEIFSQMARVLAHRSLNFAAMFRVIPTLLFLLVQGILLRGEEIQSASKVLRPLPLKDVQITDQFWAPKLRIYKERTIPHSWKYMEWELKALHRAAGENVEGPLNGTWGEANLYKFLQTVADSLALFPDSDLERRVDEIVELLGRAQQPDGFVHLFYINSKKPKWDPEFLDGSHTGYVLGHMIEAAIEYYANTGKPAFLNIARRAADEAYEHFLGPNGQPGFDGHAELEMALAELSRVTGDSKYLQLGRAFIEWRGRHKVKPASAPPRAYFQDEVPLRGAAHAGWTCRARDFFATGVADQAIETHDADYRLAANRFWDKSMTLRRMAITGSIGPRHEHEAFGEDYELPLDGYYESCAACGLADFAQRIFFLERQSDSADVLERVLYNAVLHGLSLDGTNSYYQNPLTDSNRPRYNSWVCCPPNLSRTLFQIGRYAYAASENELFVNSYIGSDARVRFKEGEVHLKVQTDYPWSGDVKLAIFPTREAQKFSLNLRVPGWCEKTEVKLNGALIDLLPLNDSHYLAFSRSWKTNDTLEVSFAMPVQRIEAHPNVKDCTGKIALQRGPLIFGFEGLDNAGQTNLVLAASPEFPTEYRSDLLGGISVITGRQADGSSFTAIPFYGLANRQKSSQEVWVEQKGMKPGAAWWEGRLYRPLK